MRVTQFQGLIPKTSDKALPNGKAVIAENLDLYGNHLRPIKLPSNTNQKLLDKCGNIFTGKPVSIHRAGSVYVAWDKKIFTAVDWTNKLGETTFLFVEDGVLYRQSAERMLARQCPIKVGINRPNKTTISTEKVDFAGCEPTKIPLLCVPNTDCDNVEKPPVATSYMFTYMNACGEESAQSEPSEVIDIKWGDAVHVIVKDNNPPDNAIKRIWYRAVTDNEELTHWLRVGETPIDVKEFYDPNCPCDFACELSTENHDAPPDCLEGVANIGDNLTMVWSNKHFWLSENNFPHAYNLINEYKLRYHILSVNEVTPKIEGEVHYSALVITDGLHYTISAQEPDKVQIAEIQQRYKCINKNSIVNTDMDVIYSAKQGIVAINQNGEELITGAILTENEWAEFEPYTINFTYNDDRLYGFKSDGGFILQFGTDKRRDPEFVTHNVVVDNGYTDETSPFVVFKGANILTWGTGETAIYDWKTQTGMMSGIWRPIACKVVSPDFDNIIPRDFKQARIKYEEWVRKNPKALPEEFFMLNKQYQQHYAQLVGIRPSVTVIIYADGREYYRKVVKSNKPFLLPRKYRAIDWAIRVIGSIRIDEIHLQSSREGLLGSE